MNAMHLFRCLGGQADVIALDELPRAPRRPSFFVVNTDKKSGPGEHWFCVHLDVKGGGEIFDSLGSVNPTAKAWMNRHCQSWSHNAKRLQSKGSDLCGAYAVYYVLYRKYFGSLDQYLKFNFDSRNLLCNDEYMYDFLINI